MTVYVDVLFLTNAIMDYATLLAAARLGGVSVNRWRVLLGAALGGLYAVGSVMAPAFGVLVFRLVCGVMICVVAYGRTACFVRVCALYAVVACAFAGLAAALGALTGNRLFFGTGYYFAVPLRVLVLAAVLGYAVSGVLLRGDAAHGAVRREIETLRIRFNGRERAVSVLHDTGNDLAEPLSGKPAIILGKNAAENVLGSVGTAIEELDRNNAATCLSRVSPEFAARFGLVPYHAIGTESGMLLYVRPDAVLRADGTKLDCVLAVSPEQMGNGGYEGLIGI